MKIFTIEAVSFTKDCFMRFTMIAVLYSLSFSALANFPTITAKNLSLNMKDNSGVGFVNFLKYNINNISLTHTALQAQVKKYPDRFIVNDTETQIDFQYPLDFLNNFSSIDLHELNLVSQGDIFDFTMEKAVLEIAKMNYEIEAASFNCSGKVSPPKTDDGPKDAFDACTNESNLLMGKLTFAEDSLMEKFFRGIVEASFKPDLKKWNPFRVRYIHNLNLDIKKSKLVGEVKIKSLIDIKFKMEGVISYLENTKEFKIELTKAKAAFIDVKKRIFKELTKLNIKELRVEPPFIYLKIKGAK